MRLVLATANRDKALELIAQGRMMPAGLAQFEAAKRDGRLNEAYELYRCDWSSDVCSSDLWPSIQP